MLNNFHISQCRLKTSEIASVKAFAPDLHECLLNIGLIKNVERVLDTEFAVAMGLLCTSLAIMGTESKVKDDWRFSEHGIIYSASLEKTFDVENRHGVNISFNHTEFSLLIGIMACRENLINALAKGHRNPFRMSYFYENVLFKCMDNIDPKHIDHDKVNSFLEDHKRPEYAAHAPYFEQYLANTVIES